MDRRNAATRRALSPTLVVVNGVLAAVLVAVSLAPSAGAQRGGRGRGEYTMVSGRIQGGNSHAVYIVDANNQEMIALRWEESRKGLEGIGYRDLSADAASNPGR